MNDWWEQLETRLERELANFLTANPAQQALLQEQEARDRQASLVGERGRLRRQAEQQRQQLLSLAEEIRSWRQRVDRARAAGAEPLAERAEAHLATLMERGRESWSQLAELGQQFAAVEAALQALAVAEQATATSAAPAGKLDELEQAWAAFEAEQQLESLRRRQS
jgi:hercynine metabolism protein